MKVHITGDRGEGKTLLAITLFKLLKIAGYSPEYIGENKDQERTIRERMERIDMMLERDNVIEIIDKNKL